MDERVITWSRGRRLRIVVMDVPADFDRLVGIIRDDSRRTDDRDLLAADVSTVFGRHVRMTSSSDLVGEEITIRVG